MAALATRGCIPQLPNFQPRCLLGNDTVTAPNPGDPAKCTYGGRELGEGGKGMGCSPSKAAQLFPSCSSGGPTLPSHRDLWAFPASKTRPGSGLLCKFFLDIPFQEFFFSGLGDGGILSCFEEREFWIRKLSLNTQGSHPELRLPISPPT